MHNFKVNTSTAYCIVMEELGWKILYIHTNQTVTALKIQSWKVQRKVLLWLEIPCGICAKLRTVAASNNRVHMPWSLYYCLFAPHICMVLFFTHIPFVVNHIINATPPEMLQQHPLLFTTNRTNRTFFVWRLNSAQPSQPGHSTILLQLEIPSGICAKLRTVAASKNRVHMPWSLYYCLFAPHIRMVLFFMHIPFVVNHTINATLPERLQQYPIKGGALWRAELGCRGLMT